MVQEIDRLQTNGREKGGKSIAPYWTPKAAGNERAAVDKIMARATEEKVRFVNLQFTDLMGIVKSVAIPLHQFEDACINGKWFDGSSIEGFARIAESDMFLVPDLESFAIIPWDRGEGFTTARLICDVFTPDGKPFAGDPRYVLKSALQEAERMGFVYHAG